jgi:hypothetical protein
LLTVIWSLTEFSNALVRGFSPARARGSGLAEASRGDRGPRGQSGRRPRQTRLATPSDAPPNTRSPSAAPARDADTDCRSSMRARSPNGAGGPIFTTRATLSALGRSFSSPRDPDFRGSPTPTSTSTSWFETPGGRSRAAWRRRRTLPRGARGHRGSRSGVSSGRGIWTCAVLRRRGRAPLPDRANRPRRASGRTRTPAMRRVRREARGRPGSGALCSRADIPEHGLVRSALGVCGSVSSYQTEFLARRAQNSSLTREPRVLVSRRGGRSYNKITIDTNFR